MKSLMRCDQVGASRLAGREQRPLNGPLPLQWLLAAARSPGRSLHLALLLWHVAGLTGLTSVQLSNTLCLRFGLDRNAKYRALRSLEIARLIVVKRKRGRSPLVTILESSGTL